MTWQAPPRSPEAAARYAAADADRRDHPERFRLDPDAVVAQVCARDELDPASFADGWRAGLEQYLASAEEDGRLNALGVRMVLGAATGRLVAGARIAQAIAAEPALTTAPLPPPIVIVGGWRTGTTYLFRLLGRDPRLHAPVPAELSAPWRFPALDAAGRRSFIDRSAASHAHLHLLNPAMAAVHLSGPRLAEECVLAMGTDLRNWGFTSTVRLDSYAEWLAEQDLGASYRRYRDVLHLLAAGDPRRFVLKAPAHTAELPHLAAAFPGAVVVHLHRDIVETVASGASLFAVFRSTYSDRVDGADVGRYQTVQTERWFRRAQAFRASAGAGALRFVDVDYRALVTDPIATLRTIYAAADLDPPEPLGEFVAAYDREQPRHGHGVHRYDPSEFGLVPGALRERFAFLDA
jgi:hypothetical protein